MENKSSFLKDAMAKTVVDSWREVLTAPEKRRNP